MRKHGRFTIPTQAGFLEETKELIRRWGADAIRNSDGTNLTEETEALRPAKTVSYTHLARAVENIDPGRIYRNYRPDDDKNHGNPECNACILLNRFSNVPKFVFLVFEFVFHHIFSFFL